MAGGVEGPAIAGRPQASAWRPPPLSALAASRDRSGVDFAFMRGLAPRELADVAPAGILASEVLARLDAATSKTRIRAFDFSEGTSTEPPPPVTLRSQPAWAISSRGTASDLSCFLSEDPFNRSFEWLPPGDPLSPDDIRDLYAYGSNDPISRVDPLGLKDCGLPPVPTGKCAADCRATLRWQRCVLTSAGFPLPTLAGGAYAVSIPNMATAVHQYRCCMRDCINYKCPQPGGRGTTPPCRMNGPPPIELYPVHPGPTPTPG